MPTKHKQSKPVKKERRETLIEKYLREILELLRLNANKPTMPTYCPHNIVDYHFQGAWSASIPPPTKICTKCGMTY